MLREIIVSICLFFTVYIGFTQEGTKKKYTLKDCITIALENNLDVKSSTLNAKTAKINYKQSKTNILPTLNGNYNIGVNNGRSIDPFTNDFINQELTFSNAQLNLDATIFNGFRLLNTIRQQRLNNRASEIEVEESKQTLILNVTLAYLQVLNNKDVLELAKNRLKTTIDQLKRQETLYNEELGNPADFADIKGQKAIDETSILIAESGLKNAELNLMSLLNVTDSFSIDVTDVLLNFENYTYSPEDIFKDALKNLATFKANTLRVEAAKKGVYIAQAQYLPEISFFGRLNTNYSSVAETFTDTGSAIQNTGDFVTIDSQQIAVQTNQTLFEGNKIEYLDQFDNNLNTVIGIAVDIPLFNGFRAKNNVSLEKIKVQESLILLTRMEQEIKNTISQVHFDMEVAYKRFHSLKKQVEAFEESFRINEIRFNNGVSNFLAYITSKNNLDTAITNLTNVKYQYVLQVKILEFYRGNNIL